MIHYNSLNGGFIEEHLRYSSASSNQDIYRATKVWSSWKFDGGKFNGDNVIERSTFKQNYIDNTPDTMKLFKRVAILFSW